ncbi:MAG: hypothetical protein ACPL3C_04435 [Pyrobaculum sp.]
MNFLSATKKDECTIWKIVAIILLILGLVGGILNFNSALDKLKMANEFNTIFSFIEKDWIINSVYLPGQVGYAVIVVPRTYRASVDIDLSANGGAVDVYLLEFPTEFHSWAVGERYHAVYESTRTLTVRKTLTLEEGYYVFVVVNKYATSPQVNGEIKVKLIKS